MPHSARTLQETSPAISIQVKAYSEDVLATVLSNDWISEQATRLGAHFDFLREYLGPVGDGLHAKTVVCEWPYISESYLEDYAQYYTRCFVPYERDCKRVHFFHHDFNEEELLAALDQDDTHAIWHTYLGYIVVKPIPAPLGATLLRPYVPGSQQERHYPVKRSYQVNLLGKKLTLATLIWQQQDTNVSACATTALWMAFHKTAYMFQTPLPSPYRITESAGNLFNHSGRSFPNQGLDPFQIMTAIQSVGLVSELRNKFPDPRSLSLEDRTLKEKELKAFTYAYLKLGLPVLLFIDFADLGGAHLIAATGYRAPEPTATYAATTVTSGSNAGHYPALYADNIEQFYAHDDGVGPYARLCFEAVSSLVITSWPKGSDWHRAHLYTVVVPLINEIRITYEQVYEQAALLDILLQYLRPFYETDVAGPVVWDIYLQRSNEHKEKTLAGTDGTLAQRQRIGRRLLPKYVWLARALYQGQPLIEFIFDATDLHTGFYCLLTTTYEPLRAFLMADITTAESETRNVLQQLEQLRYMPLLLDDTGAAAPTAP